MMQQYTDSNGDVCEAVQLPAPTVLTTVNGETCGEAGQWAVYVAASDGRPFLFTDEAFRASFTPRAD